MTAQPTDKPAKQPAPRSAKLPAPRTLSSSKTAAARPSAKPAAAQRAAAARSTSRTSQRAATTVLEPVTEAAPVVIERFDTVSDLVPAQAAPRDAQLKPIPAAPVAVPQPYQPPASPMQVNVQVAAPVAPQVVIQVKQRGLFVRALYYVFVGWWLSGLMMFAAGACIASVVLLPAGLAMVNRLPQVMTLRPRSVALNAAMLTDGSMQYTVGSAQQRSLLVRTVYFCLIGWWAGMFVMFTAWVLSVMIVTMPLGLMLLNRVPAAVTLRRN